MDRFEALRLYTRIVELGSFTRAAETLGLPRATATLAIKQLEARLGTRLLERTTRQVRTTLDGQAYYERGVRVLADLEDAEAALAPVQANPRGTLRVDMQGTLAAAVVLPRLPEFLARYPLLDLKLSSGDRYVDLLRENIDCVLRAGELADSSLVARRVATLPQITCAAASYLQRHGTPRTPDDLASHAAVNYYAGSTGRNEAFDFERDGVRIERTLGGVVAVSSAELYIACAEAGLGLVQLPRYRLEAQLRAGTLVEVLADWPPPPMPVSVLYPQHRQLSPRVRVFTEWIARIFRERFGDA